MPTVLIIGTSHAFQRDTPDTPAGAIHSFRDFLRQAVVANDAAAISEEMSSAALAENGLERSVAQRIASDLGIRHDLADPSPEDRERLGIQQRNDIELAGFHANWDRAEIEAQVHRSYDIREGFWVSRLSALGLFPAVFICGASHVRSFQDKLQAVGHDVVVLAENWAPGVGA